MVCWLALEISFPLRLFVISSIWPTLESKIENYECLLFSIFLPARMSHSVKLFITEILYIYLFLDIFPYSMLVCNSLITA